MGEHFASFCDDFFVNVELNTSLPLPEGRETILQFCEAVQKKYPDLGDFYQREGGEYVLEGDRNAGSYRWMELSARRLSTGAFNPTDTEAACRQHSWILERSRFYLGIRPLDVESLDLVYGFNLDYVGNRDAIVCEALLSGSNLGAVAAEEGTTALNFEPGLVVALDPECGLQARIAIETRNSSFQVRTGQYEDEPISVYFTVRAYPRPGEQFGIEETLAHQAELGEELLDRVVVPRVVQSIASAIAAAQ